MKPVSVRQRLPYFSLACLALVMLMTFGNAAGNMMFTPFPTKHELQQREQRATADARRARIIALLTEGDRCRAQTARELARALVFDGRSAKEYADDYARRCGEDPIVRRWGDAPSPRASRR